MPIKSTRTPKKVQKTRTTRPPTATTPTTNPIVPETPSVRPRVNLVELAKRSLALQTRHASVKDGSGRPVVRKPQVAVRYMVQFDDETVLFAEGEHADVVFRYLQECEQLCATQGLAYYEGPGLSRTTRAAWLAKCGGS